ncbi:hypothetical protein L1987_05591 [Smallanthus sonchifolius]|uniref:Uncharacterized protein n=1 Tax=Smallanthus sonchifolius TaxID=185202 RepID=A0ACB9JVS0_9ASTR|nr:hypothetical protein L1987_05591 [Smallanthus sonchifolius]
MSTASIRKKAIEVGARVDAETSCTSVHTSGTKEFSTSLRRVSETEDQSKGTRRPEGGLGIVVRPISASELKASWFQEKPDLNKKPEPEDLDGENRS